MDFMTLPLATEPFSHLFGRTDDELSVRGARAMIADEKPGFPCRVSLRDAEPGERVILLNHEHLPTDSPYRSRHAVFVIDGAVAAEPLLNTVPDYLTCRLLSVRAFDADDMMLDADVCDGHDAAALFRRLLARSDCRYLHVHSARRGCYLARVEPVR